jgi:hypothetical protein
MKHTFKISLGVMDRNTKLVKVSNRGDLKIKLLIWIIETEL